MTQWHYVVVPTVTVALFILAFRIQQQTPLSWEAFYRFFEAPAEVIEDTDILNCPWWEV